jgi:hypothetical protein
VGPADQSTDRLEIVMRDLFLRSSRIHPTLLSKLKRLPHMTCRECVRVMCIRFLLQDVHRFKSS